MSPTRILSKRIRARRKLVADVLRAERRKRTNPAYDLDAEIQRIMGAYDLFFGLDAIEGSR